MKHLYCNSLHFLFFQTHTMLLFIFIYFYSDVFHNSPDKTFLLQVLEKGALFRESTILNLLDPFFLHRNLFFLLLLFT